MYFDIFVDFIIIVAFLLKKISLLGPYCIIKHFRCVLEIGS